MKKVLRTVCATAFLMLWHLDARAADADAKLLELAQVPKTCAQFISKQGTAREKGACRNGLEERIVLLKKFAKDGHVSSLRMVSLLRISPEKRCAVAATILDKHRADVDVVVDFLGDQISEDGKDIMHRTLAPKALETLKKKLDEQTLRDAYVQYVRSELDSYKKSFAKCGNLFNSWLYGVLAAGGSTLNKKIEALMSLLTDRLAARDEKAMRASIHLLILGGQIAQR